MLTKSKKSTKCLHHPKAVAKWRGVCLSCYFTAKRKIEAGDTTDQKLVKAGFWQAPKKRRGAVNDLIDDLLAKSGE